ncbi:DUF87 domain-containing protein [Patulibacter sp. NPDC049589]|uniref:ATP-binding protein n=1 Tax=Patulibacter sp. NPDC049589 TaxID=3154731 RepID=UPI003425389D
MSSSGSHPLERPIDRQNALTIATVESVAPSQLIARLSDEAPFTTSLNAGAPTPFPRLNSFVVVAHESGAMVGMVTWIGAEAARWPPGHRRDETGLVDLPYPSRRMAITPIGTLERGRADEAEPFALRRGVTAFPTVGDSVAVPSREQLDALMRGRENDRRVQIGTAPLANGAQVWVDPDKVFGRHLAVLGNTGSGKSCSVAGLIRWSLEAARTARGTPSPRGSARFIVLDPNGEYSQAFGDLDGCKVYRVSERAADPGSPLEVPGWLMNSHEWASVSYASARVQKPVLVQALRNLKGVRHGRVARLAALGSFAHNYSIVITMFSPPAAHAKWGQRKDVRASLTALRDGLEGFRDLDGDGVDLDPVAVAVKAVVAHCGRGDDPPAPTLKHFESVIGALKALVESVDAQIGVGGAHEDVPRPFDVSSLADELGLVAARGQFEEAQRHIGGMKLRVQSLIDDKRLGPILKTHSDVQPDLDEWLGRFLGTGNGDSVAVLDLSLVPSDVIEIVVAVAARMTFEALQRHRRMNDHALPTALVLEEAHAFVRDRPWGDEQTSPGELSTRAFERIAREGRKFGLGLVISSQRPSELSPTVLAQCNSFLLHRIVNDADQRLVGRLVPDNLAGLLDDLPSLPSQQALLVGWATTFPTLVDMRELAEEHRPRSSDPDFWEAWTGARDVPVDWKTVAEHWAGEVDDGEPPADAEPPPTSPSDDDIPF